MPFCRYATSFNVQQRCSSTFTSEETLAWSKLGDAYDPTATDYICWDPKIPVKIRLEKEAPKNVPAILCQTMLRKTVKKYPDSTAIAFKRDTNVIRWSYKVC